MNFKNFTSGEYKYMKKLLSLLIAVLLIFSAFSASASALFDSGAVTDNLKSEIYYMENLDEEKVFFSKNSEERTPAAAFVKIIACLVALEKWGNLEGSVTVTQESLSMITYDYGVRVASYKEGEVISKKELFDCLLIYGANDAASIIAYEISGTIIGFINEMQAMCDKIGCTSTVVKNLTGFDVDGQYTTASDVAKIIKYAVKYPAFSESFAADKVVLKATDQNEERTFTSSNKMTNAAISDYYHSSVTAGKQTSTKKAGECIAVVSSKDGYSYLTVVMKGKRTDIDNDTVDENTCMTDAKKMLDWVYDNIRYRAIVSPTQTVEIVDVVAGKGTDSLRLIPEKETSTLVPAKATPASVMIEIVEDSMPKKLVAPIKAGKVICQAKVYYAGLELATVNLVAANDVKLSFVGLIMSAIKSVIGSTFFLVLSLILSVAAIGVFVFNLLDMNNSKGKKKSPSEKKNIDKAGGAKEKDEKKNAQAKKISETKKTSAEPSEAKKKPALNKGAAKKSVKTKTASEVSSAAPSSQSARKRGPLTAYKPRTGENSDTVTSDKR